jgi:hypothetical protein
VPFSAKANAAARPMPELPPVMMTTLFSYAFIVPSVTFVYADAPLIGLGRVRGTDQNYASAEAGLGQGHF